MRPATDQERDTGKCSLISYIHSSLGANTGPLRASARVGHKAEKVGGTVAKSLFCNFHGRNEAE